MIAYNQNNKVIATAIPAPFIAILALCGSVFFHKK
jgi:hypothetical protein